MLHEAVIGLDIDQLTLMADIYYCSILTATNSVITSRTDIR